jgi:hypothetical protein
MCSSRMPIWIIHRIRLAAEDFDGQGEGTAAVRPTPGLLAQVEHKLRAYTWNLVHNYLSDFTLV